MPEVRWWLETPGDSGPPEWSYRAGSVLSESWGCALHCCHPTPLRPLSAPLCNVWAKSPWRCRSRRGFQDWSAGLPHCHTVRPGPASLWSESDLGRDTPTSQTGLGMRRGGRYWSIFISQQWLAVLVSSENILVWLQSHIPTLLPHLRLSQCRGNPVLPSVSVIAYFVSWLAW